MAQGIKIRLKSARSLNMWRLLADMREDAGGNKVFIVLFLYFLLIFYLYNILVLLIKIQNKIN
ncbi:MAG: hypothetical protein GY928_13110 [Colwellia sp.]|nr:hypothetical protein [Colwellia sp.]